MSPRDRWLMLRFWHVVYSHLDSRRGVVAVGPHRTILASVVVDAIAGVLS